MPRKRKDSVVHITMYDPKQHRPSLISRNLSEVKGARHDRRPSKVARKAGALNGTAVQWADTYDQPDTWEEEEMMPYETRLADCGWRPGPATRNLPKFRGRTPGPTDSTLDTESSVRNFFNTQLTTEFKEKVVQYTHEHCKQWRESNPEWQKSNIERSMMKYRKSFTAQTFELWLACRMRIAQLKPEIPACSLWFRSTSLFDVQVFNVMTLQQYQWINRHLSFADGAGQCCRR